MTEDRDSSTDEPATEIEPNAVTSTYKMLGEFTATDGSAVLGQNNAGSGTPVGVEGAVPNADGYGLSTPDDAKVGGTISTTGNFDFSIENDSGTALGIGARDTFEVGQDPTLTFEGSGNSVTGQLNTVKSTDIVSATISGGGVYDQTNDTYYRNTVTDHGGTVGGGFNNRAGDDDSDLVSAESATVAGGDSNTASGSGSVVGGGTSNNASGTDSTVAGGASNESSSQQATVGGGQGNTASKQYATVPGGELCTADGEASFAAGRQAKAGGYDGAFVWGGSNFVDVTATAAEEVRFRAAGGFAIQDGDLAIEDGEVTAPNLNTGSGTPLELDNGKIVKNTSSARYKTNIGPAETDTAAALELEPKSFEYEDSGQEDVGLIAEEVEETLPELVNYDEEGRPESISYNRIGAFLAPEVRENRDRLERKNERIDELEAENDDLRAELDDKDERIDELENRLTAIEDRLDAPAQPADD
jgi:polyhydroxyalkanoate synthesis regulator phasin